MNHPGKTWLESRGFSFQRVGLTWENGVMNSSRIFARCSALVCALAGAPSALAAIVYVDASATSGADDGTSWSDAFQGPSGLRRALAAAASGDEDWVADGTYLPTLSGVRTRSFDLKTNVKLYGGFVGGETSLSQRDPCLAFQRGGRS
jgi:hypothetical protein